jgi:hypothetical protein
MTKFNVLMECVCRAVVHWEDKGGPVAQMSLVAAAPILWCLLVPVIILGILFGKYEGR